MNDNAPSNPSASEIVFRADNVVQKIAVASMWLMFLVFLTVYSLGLMEDTRALPWFGIITVAATVWWRTVKLTVDPFGITLRSGLLLRRMAWADIAVLRHGPDWTYANGYHYIRIFERSQERHKIEINRTYFRWRDLARFVRLVQQRVPNLEIDGGIQRLLERYPQS